MKDLFKTIILDSQNRFPHTGITKRDLQVPVESKFIISVIGPRRCGKTYFFFSLINDLIEQGIDKTRILYFNFEDERLDLRIENLQILLDSYYELFPANLSKKIFLFFDEIQEVPDWEKFIRRVNDNLDSQIFLTGSSSKMLNTEIASSLRGRCLAYNLYPFSFKEYCRHQEFDVDDLNSTKNRITLSSSFEKYLKDGGFPDTIGVNSEVRTKILKSYFDVMIYRDIIERYQINNTTALRNFILQLAGTISSEFSVNKIYHDLKSRNITVSKDQLYEFLSYTVDCFLFFVLNPLGFSARNLLNKKKKVYFIDNGLLSRIRYIPGENSGKLLENLIFLELVRRKKNIFFWRDSFECDFIIEENNVISNLIQVSYNISDDKTRAREIKSLLTLAEKYPGSNLLLINKSQDSTFEKDDKKITIIPAWKWLLT